MKAATRECVRFSRAWAMPSHRTFSIKPIYDLLERYCQPGLVIVDPFCNASEWATLKNDLNPIFNSGGMDAEAWCHTLPRSCADVILFDPPYSPRQIAEVYGSVGLKVGKRETQSGHLYARVRRAMAPLLVPGGIAISFGWNSAGFGKSLGFTQEEILLVAHGGAHNDTIVTVERKAAA